MVLAIFGGVLGMVMGTVYGLAGIIPDPKYMGAVMVGNGIAGISSNVLRVIFVATFPSGTLFLQAIIFFSLTFVYMIICGCLFTQLETNEFFIYHSENAQKSEILRS